jgi:hypothetical protein
VESKWKNYHITTFPGFSLSKTLEEAMDLSQDRPILELEPYRHSVFWVYHREEGEIEFLRNVGNVYLSLEYLRCLKTGY